MGDRPATIFAGLVALAEVFAPGVVDDGEAAATTELRETASSGPSGALDLQSDVAGRRTNVALLVLLAAALATGTIAFGVGSAAGRAVLIAHGVVGLAMLLLGPWKSAIVRRGIKRRRPGRTASTTFLALVAVALVSGFVHAAGSRGPVAGLGLMQIHVGSALASLPFGVWHLIARRTPLRRTDLSRRNLLRAGGVLGAAAAAYAGLEGGFGLLRWPGARRRFTGSHEQRPAGDVPVTSWLNDRVPQIDERDWKLDVVAGRSTRRWTRTELAGLAAGVQATLDCTGGWYAEQTWEAVPLVRLVREASEMRSVLVTSATGYRRRFPLRDLPHLYLAVGAGGEPLDPGHGAPARIVAPQRRGFWWVKWVTSIETSPLPAWWQSPFPLT